MASIASPAEQRIVLENVSWETYQRLLSEHVDSTGTRFAYDGGSLEIMVVHAEHEEINRTLAAVAEAAAMAMERDFCRLGSTTFRRQDLSKGFEPDSSFYFENADKVRGKAEIDLVVDPPPDLIIEVDLTSSSLNRFAIFAAIGVREVWRYAEGQLTISALDAGQYRTCARSVVLPPLTPVVLARFVEQSRHLKPHLWFARIQEWVRRQR